MKILLTMLAWGLVSACASDSAAPPPVSTPVPTTLVVEPQAIALSDPGARLTLAVAVLDQFGEPLLEGPAPVVSSDDPATVLAQGLTVAGIATGSTTLRISVGGLATTRPATVGPFPADPQWAPLPNSPVSSAHHFMDASFLSPARGWVVGFPGQVYHTADSGNTWDQRHAGTTGSFRAVAFVNDTLGWVGELASHNATSGRALLETTDGGRTWTEIKHRIVGPEPVGLCGMFVIDSNSVVAVGRWNGPAVFVRTDDAGATWSSTSLAPLATGAVDVHFFDEMNGIVAAGRGVGNSAAEQEASRVVVLGTSDGGVTWQERYVSTFTGAWSWKISFPTPLIGYIATQGPGYPTIVLKTTNGGQTWSELVVNTGGRAGGFWGIGFVTAQRGWVARTSLFSDPLDPVDDIFETTDGGITWTRRGWAAGENPNRFRLFGGVGYAMGTRVFRFVQ